MRAAALTLLAAAAAPAAGQYVYAALNHTQNRRISKDWCPFVAGIPGFHNWGNISQLLRGQKLYVAAAHEPPFIIINESLEHGVGWGKEISGYEVDLLQAIAAIGEFDIEFHKFVKNDDETWTSALLRQKDWFDFVGGGWVDTSNRRKLSVTFTAQINDFGMVLVMPQPVPAKPTVWENAFFFWKPFTGAAYGIAVLIAFFPALLVWALERERHPGVEGVAEMLFMGFLNILGFGDYSFAERWPARVIMILWAFCCTVLISGYTASLTTFFVSTQTTSIGVHGPLDLLQKGMTACVGKGTALQALVMAKWGTKYGKQVIPVPTRELTAAAFNGTCDGFFQLQDYVQVLLAGGPAQLEPTDGGQPYGCREQQVGGSAINGVGAFPAGNSECRWFVVQVLDSILRLLNENRELERIFAQAVSRVSRHVNGAPLCDQDDQTPAAALRLGADHLVGLVVITVPGMVLLTVLHRTLWVALGREVLVAEEAEGEEGDEEEIDVGDYARVIALQSAKKLSTRMSLRRTSVASPDAQVAPGARKPVVFPTIAPSPKAASPRSQRVVKIGGPE
eukprot:TRINITY_DN50857_c0_g1_i1.p1 TRINITY_DN50857_c0_g1~~TRINITY_DN50857_c0_g1_i1.p1  ORF type:complete len:564 (+),score=153.91 TRINITY_DN50857_c0_g1_i1:84-1775(+)